MQTFQIGWNPWGSGWGGEYGYILTRDVVTALKDTVKRKAKFESYLNTRAGGRSVE